MQYTGFRIVINIVVTFLTGTLLYAQDPDSVNVTSPIPVAVADSSSSEEDAGVFVDDTLYSDPDSVDYTRDSTGMLNDSLVNDTVSSSDIGSSITDLVDYDALDSLNFSMDGGTVEMYNQAIITYGDIKLEAGYIKYQMQLSEVEAYGIPDSTGEIVQNPVFSEGEDSYEAKYIRYNFKTKRGYIEEVITEQEGGFLHSQETKMHKNGHIHMKDGKYTTCDAEHPHFYVAITKGISMPGDKIIAGPAYMVVEDVPLPIGVPFGFFPNSRKKTSGILIPQYGEEKRRGFYLRDGGFYFAMNDYMDLRVSGDIYSNGTWGVRAGSNYRVRYKFNGNLNIQYFNNITGYKNIEGLYSVSKDYSVGWSHAQAREANPNSNFRASVNLSSSSYDKNHTSNINQVVTNTKQSSISYSRSWPNSPFNLSAALNHSQNSNTGGVNMTLPKISFNMGRITPFERKKRVGPKKWYEDIQLRYSSLLENRIRTNDTLLFTNQVWSDMSNGFRHEIPLSLNIKPFKKVAALQNLTITPNMSYSGMVYTGYTEKSITGYDEVEEDGMIVSHPVVQDTTYEGRLRYAHAYLPRVSASMSPKLYGMYQFSGNSRLTAIRHVMTPSANISYVPDMTGIQPDYYRDLYDSVNNVLLETYSIFEDQIYGTPTFNGASGSLSLSLRNNLEAKMVSRNDTIDELEKVKLLDNFNFSTNYNFFNRDSLSPSWAPINMNGNTRLFKNKLSVSFRGVLDPFGYDETRSRVNETYFSQSGKLVRLTRASITMGTSFSSKSGKEDEEEGEEDDPLLNSAFDNNGINDPNAGYDPSVDDQYGDYVDFDVPWSVNIDYSFNYRKQKDVSDIVQTVRLSGDLSLTPKWKIGFNTGYDIFNRQFTTTNLSLYRDLHCWEMRISVVPFGSYKSYNFQINAKSSILSDLKYDKRKSWQDNF
ncbi:MAG: LPS-assembly protein LptD [Bacteroidales bacterium]|nr:LPS-assembly protein LptD [Bacteroidales bacterium]